MTSTRHDDAIKHLLEMAQWFDSTGNEEDCRKMTAAADVLMACRAEEEEEEEAAK